MELKVAFVDNSSSVASLGTKGRNYKLTNRMWYRVTTNKEKNLPHRKVHKRQCKVRHKQFKFIVLHLALFRKPLGGWRKKKPKRATR